MEGFVNPFRGQIAVPPRAGRQRVRVFREQSHLGIYIVCALLVVAMPTGLVTARPLYVTFKGWRAERLTIEAEGLVQQAKWEVALSKASAAYLLSPGGGRNARLIARIFG